MFSSHLVNYAKLTAVFVPNSHAWSLYGEAAWRQMIDELFSRPRSQRIMGIDAEWYRSNPLAVIQLSTMTHCFVIHLSYFIDRQLPASVKAAFENADIIKCGVGINGDVARLEKEQKLMVRTILDVENYCFLFGLTQVGQSNLKSLTRTLVGVEIRKEFAITISNWELPLNGMQIAYAADDAVASLLIGEILMLNAVKAQKGDEDFDAAAWLRHTSGAAAMARKQAIGDHSRRIAEERKEKNGTSGKDYIHTKVQCGERVRVLDQNGQFIFECSPSRAKFYILEKGIAKITKYLPSDKRKATEIQLLFDPKVKTKLCMYFQQGYCELGEQCPFAHGLEELVPEARALLTSRIPSCASCLGTKQLAKHAVLPPAFRRFLPPPYCYAGDRDFIPICPQCNSIIRHLYDSKMNAEYKRAESLSQNPIRIDIVAKCVSYARLLLDYRKVQKIPYQRQDDLRAYIMTHWKMTHLSEMSRDNYNPIIISQEDMDFNFLDHLSKVVPGEVRCKFTVDTLVGVSVDKAKEFVEAWRNFCFDECKMIDKESNCLTPTEWLTCKGSASSHTKARA